MKIMSALSPERILSEVNGLCSQLGLQSHLFKVGWYNDKVEPSFHLPYSPDTLALIIISKPSMFELLFKPFLSSPNFHPESMDPLDQCLRNTFKELAKLFPGQDIERIQDFELHPNRRPKVLVQTAGHVAGAARYYQRRDVIGIDPWGEDKRIYGVSVHPKYGGWFALRGILIFKDVVAPDLPWKEPVDCVPTNEMRIDLLNKYNMSWQDWTFRDVSATEIVDRYSEEQKMYFETPPKDRFKLIQQYQTPL